MLSFEAVLSEPVLVAGVPTLDVLVGPSGSAVVRKATYTGGSGSSRLTFSYAVAAGDSDGDGIGVVGPVGLPSAASLPLLADSFTRPNGTSIAGWSELSGDFELLSNRVTPSVSGTSLMKADGVTATDQVVQASVNVFEKNNGSAGLVARMGGPNDSTYYLGQLVKIRGKSSLELWRSVGGLFTRIGGSVGVQSSAGTLRFEVRGTTLSLSFGGRTVTAQDGVITGPGSIGIRTGGFYVSVDDVQVDGLNMTSSIRNAIGTPAATTFEPASFSLVKVDTVGPTAVFQSLPPSRNTAVSSVGVTFSEAVSGIGLSSFRLSRNGVDVPLSSASLTGSGSVYSLGSLSSLTNATGGYVLTLAPGGISDAAGNPMASGPSVGWTTDVTPPASPTLSSVTDDSGIITGPVAPGGATDDATLRLQGKAEAGSSVEIFSGSDRLGSVTASSIGDWSFTTPALSDRVHSLKARATDTAGNTGPFSGVYVVSVDTVSPKSAITAVPVARAYKAGESLAFIVTFDEAVDVVAGLGIPPVPSVELGIGSMTRQATYVAGSGTNALRFEYTVVPGDHTEAESSVSVGAALLFNGGSDIRDVAGNQAGTAFTSAASTDGVRVDTTPPQASFAALPEERNSPVTSVGFAFDEAVVGVAIGAFSLKRDGVDVPLADGDNTAVVLGSGASYTLAGLAPFTEAPGAYVLALQTSSIVDAAGNAPVAPVELKWDVLKVPDAPTNLFVYAGDGQATLTWNASKTGGNSPVTDYLIEFSGNGGETWVRHARPASTATTAVIDGLVNGTAYVFRVAAQNRVGQGINGSISKPLMPLATAPQAHFQWESRINGLGQEVAWIKGYSGPGGAVGIPRTLGGLSVSAIDSRSFRSKGLTAVAIPDTVTYVGSGAFSDNAQLAHVSIPDGVRRIDMSAFFGARIASLTLPSTLTTFDASAAAGCDELVEIIVDERNPSFASRDGVLFDKQFTRLIRYPGGRKGEYRVPDGCGIDGAAFNSSVGLSAIVLPAGLSEIPEAAFAYCVNLKRVVIPEGVTAIRRFAFANCTKLDRLVLPTTIVTLEQDIVGFCESLLGIYVLGNAPAVTGNGLISYYWIPAIVYRKPSATGWGNRFGGLPVNTFTSVASDPPELTAVDPDNGAATLSWATPWFDGGSPITAFQVQTRYRDGLGNFVDWTDAARVDSNATAVMLGELVNGLNYSFRVAAITSAGVGQFSAVREATPFAAWSAPSEPLGLFATAGDGVVNLSWSPPVDTGESAITGYVLQSSTSEEFEQSVEHAVMSTSHTLSGLSNGVRHYFRVVAQNSSGRGTSSELTYAVPQSANPDSSTSTRLEVSAWGVSSSQIDVSWNRVTATTRYDLYIADTFQVNPSLARFVASVGATTTQYSITGLADTKKYWVIVVAHQNTTSQSRSWGSATTFVASYIPRQPAARTAYRPVSGPLFAKQPVPQEIYNEDDYFYPTYKDVVQGSVGDCWLLAALAARAATFPEGIKRMFEYVGPWTVGGHRVELYRVTFNLRTSNPVSVIVDTLLPAGGRTYARPANNTLWAPLLEKAYAVANGLGYVRTDRPGVSSYEALDGGFPSWALNAIAGSRYFDYAERFLDFTNLNDQLQGDAWPVVLGTGDRPPDTGIVNNHAYAVVDYDSAARRYLIYNPWGARPDGLSFGYVAGRPAAGLFWADETFLRRNFIIQTNVQWRTAPSEEFSLGLSLVLGFEIDHKGMVAGAIVVPLRSVKSGGFSPDDCGTARGDVWSDTSRSLHHHWAWQRQKFSASEEDGRVGKHPVSPQHEAVEEAEWRYGIDCCWAFPSGRTKQAMWGTAASRDNQFAQP